jgi:hypothetical protein
MIRRTAPLWLALLLAPAAAGAQTITISTPISPGLATYTFTDASCANTLSLQWTYTTLGYQLSAPLKLWATAGTCGDAPLEADKRYDDVPYTTVLLNKTGTFSVVIADLPGFNGATVDGGSAGIACGEQGVTKTQYVCGASAYLLGTYATTTSPLQATSLALVYDTQPPEPPSITSASGVDGTIKVAFTASSDSARVLAELDGPADGGFVEVGSNLASAGTMTLTGLLNGVSYQLRLRATDTAGNLSGPSPEVTVVPIPTCGFFCVLHDAGITETGGGCAAAPAPPGGDGQPWSLALSALVPLAALALGRALARKKNRT